MKARQQSFVLVCLLSFTANLFGQVKPQPPEPDQLAAVSSPPISGTERLHWTVKSTVGTGSLVTGVFSSAWNTAINEPEEYGPHYSGFAKRYGMRLTGVAASNSIEAGVGAIWKEDPRYVSSNRDGLIDRVKYAGRMTFFARRADGTIAPAYARYIAVPTSNFISNSWRVESESSVSSALVRTGLGFAGRFVGNVIQELWGQAPAH